MEFAKLLSQMPRTPTDNTRAREILQNNPGYLPIAVLPAEGGKILWLDVQTHRFSEAKFRSALEVLLRWDPPPILLETNISLLHEAIPLSDTLEPAGFIFFVHRCGSTLLAKALAQSPRNLVMHEADALHEGLWAYLSDSWTQPITATPENLNLIRNLVLALGRRRTLDLDTYFVKFNPWHTVFMDTIHAAFPKVRCLFMYREPTEVLVSVVKTPAPIMSNIQGTPFAAVLSKLSVEQTQQVGYVDYFAKIYQNFMHTALHSTIPNLKYLNYSHLKAEHLPLILAQGFGYHPAFEELVLMQKQFDYYSKDDKKSIHFSCDKAAKQELITPEIQQAVKQCELDVLYAQLEQTANNLFRSQQITGSSQDCRRSP